MRGDCRTEPPGRIWLEDGLRGWWNGGGGTEVDGCADYCEGLSDVSYSRGAIRTIGLLVEWNVPGGV
jgi:hypothetical protein